MIVDAHTHTWGSPEQLGASSAERIRNLPRDPWDRPDASAGAFERAMQPVQFAFVLGLVSRHLGASITAADVAARVAHRPEKYLGFTAIDPTDSDAPDQVGQATRLGLVGVTVSPAGQNISPLDPRMMKLMERCERDGLPVIVQSETHLGAPAKLSLAQPYHWEEVALAFPRLRLVLAQAGYPWLDQTLILLAKHRHVYADLSDLTGKPWLLYQSLLAAHEQGVTHKLLLGSDFPFCTPEQAIHNIYQAHARPHGSALPVVPREVLRSIIERDALACLDIPRPAASHPAPGIATETTR